MTDYTELDTYIAALPIAYRAEFLPQSVSQNATSKYRSLNWKIGIAPAQFARQLDSHGVHIAVAMVTDYMQGIGHLPGYIQGIERSIAGDGEVRHCCEHGVTMTGTNRGNGRATMHKIPAPLLRDVLHSLVLDASVLDYATFEDWAGDLGIDPDSRKGEASYRECLEIALRLRALIGDSAIATLRELFQDY